MWFFVVCRLLFCVGSCVLFVGCLLFVVCGVLLRGVVVRCLLLVVGVCCLLFDVANCVLWLWLPVVCCLLVAVVW